MALTTPVDREFAVLPRGWIRDRVVLANFREGLRALTNPETGLPFTSDEIQRATQPGSRWYVAAQAIDDYGQGEQRKALWMADQIRIERASTKWLEGYHARLWGAEKLAATGGSGEVTVTGTIGTIVLGSTTLGAPGAYTARDGAGNVYQVLTTETMTSGSLNVTMSAIGTGEGTNAKVAGGPLTWVTRDPNMDPTATVVADFTGGTSRETDADQASRIAGIIRHRPGGGNDAQVRAWARSVSNAIEEGFVYPCAFFAGSILIAITQKRGTATGPTKRQPSVGTLANAIAYLTPPLSPVVSPRAFVVVTGWNAQPSDIALQLVLQKASPNGWTDPRPFPARPTDAAPLVAPRVVAVTDNTHFDISCPRDATLPGQAALATLPNGSAVPPTMMIWDDTQSAFLQLSVLSIQDLGGFLFRVILNSPPTGVTVATGMRISPAMSEQRRAIVAAAITDYFDTLGPGELFDLAQDPRGGRCERFPATGEDKPSRAGAVVATRVIEALGGSSADGALMSMSRTLPDYPTNLVNGPNMITCGHVGVYEL